MANQKGHSMLRRILSIVFLASLTAFPIAAQDLATPEGAVILTVSGNVKVKNADDTAQFDLAMLEAMGGKIIETSTIWTKGVHRFEGVALDVFVKRLGLTGETLRATAINEYSVVLPLSDALNEGAMIAYRMDGQEMSVRDKGPLWIIYPYDSDADFRTEVIYARSIWQLDRIQAID
jgi:hypothetical protein